MKAFWLGPHLGSSSPNFLAQDQEFLALTLQSSCFLSSFRMCLLGTYAAPDPMLGLQRQ